MNFKKFRGGKAMNKVLAIICCVSCIGLVACGAATYESNKETDIQSASSVVTVEAQDSTATLSASHSTSTSTSTPNTESSLSEQSTEQIQTPVQETEAEPYEVEIVEEQEMYATEACNLREGPSSDDYNKIGSLSKGEAVEVVGIVKQYKGNTVLWYQTSTGAYVNGAYISDSLPSSVSVDATGVNGKLEDGEVGQDLSEEPSSTYQGGYTPEELDKMAEDIMKELAKDNGWTDSSESSETPPTTYTRSDGVTVTVTPSSGELPNTSTFGSGDYTGLEGDFIQ